MTIHSFSFLLLCALLCTLYYLIPQRRQNLLLLFASYGIYAAMAWSFLVILVIITFANYLLGLMIDRARRPGGWVAAGIALNVATFLAFKSSDFFVPEFRSFISVMGGRTQTEGFALILPVGLSFYLLQCISYLVDVGRGQLKASRDLLTFALYLSYFPKLTAGPIERARSFLPQLTNPRTVDNDLIARSFTLLVIGLFRKIVIADTLLLAIPPDIFNSASTFSSPALASWMVAYAFGLYNDFCGYTDIVRGISGFFGIELSPNFRQPFLSRNFSDLWTRWHITLSLWLRDYVYFPLSRAIARRGRGLKNPYTIFFPPLVAMLASGLWHGIKPSYLAWGGIMGAYLGVENLVASKRPIIPLDQRPFWRQLLGMGMVFVLSVASFNVFLLGPIDSPDYFSSLFTNLWWDPPASRVFLLFIPSLAIDLIQYHRNSDTVFLDMPRPVRVLLLAVAAVSIAFFSQSEYQTPFIYQAF